MLILAQYISRFDPSWKQENWGSLPFQWRPWYPIEIVFYFLIITYSDFGSWTIPLLLTKFILHKNDFAQLLVTEIGPPFSDKRFWSDLQIIPVAAAIVMDVVTIPPASLKPWIYSFTSPSNFLSRSSGLPLFFTGKLVTGFSTLLVVARRFNSFLYFAFHVNKELAFISLPSVYEKWWVAALLPWRSAYWTIDTCSLGLNLWYCPRELGFLLKETSSTALLALLIVSIAKEADRDPLGSGRTVPALSRLK